MHTQTDDAYASPRITALRDAWYGGDTAALDTFWQEMQATGTPLIEPFEGRDDVALVTFVWRGDATTTHVVLYSEFLRGMWWNGWADALLMRLGDSTTFYRSYRIRTDMRFVYWIAPNHPLHHIKDVTDWEHYHAQWQLDPLNPRVFDQDLNRSYVEMPAAPPQIWFQPRAGVPSGQVERTSWHSTLLGNERTIWIYTPPEYETRTDPCAVLFLFDGDVYTSSIPAPTICDNLLAAEQIPPLMLVMLDSPDRQHELYSNEAFADALVHELYPFMRQNYRITSDPRQTIVGGVSAGGVAAAFVGLRHSQIFGNVLSQSGNMGWSREAAAAAPWSYEIPPPDCSLIEQCATAERVPLRWYLDAGLLEDQRDASQTTVLRANRHLHNVLRARGYWVHYTEFCGGHQYLNWRGTFPQALIALFGRSSP